MISKTSINPAETTSPAPDTSSRPLPNDAPFLSPKSQRHTLHFTPGWRTQILDAFHSAGGCYLLTRDPGRPRVAVRMRLDVEKSSIADDHEVQRPIEVFDYNSRYGRKKSLSIS